MSSEAGEAGGLSEYISHHLQHLRSPDVGSGDIRCGGLRCAVERKLRRRNDSHDRERRVLDPMPQKHVREAARGLAPGSWMEMACGAGHDAQILQQVMPAAMVFIPSGGGVSHSFAEDSGAEDIVLGCEVAAEVVPRLLPR